MANGNESAGPVKYRMYVDEVGNSDLDSSRDPNHRYLSLTGVVVELAYVQTTLFPQIENLKYRYFLSHPDEPVILHRKELVNRRHPFTALRMPETEQAFNKELLNLLTVLDYRVMTVVIDKLEHTRRYQVWRSDPYHYCMTVLAERFVLWLNSQKAIGDVMTESRGGKEDRRLKKSFNRIFTEGTSYVKPETFEQHLTSRQLKVKAKTNNIAGLQIADLIAHPSYKAVVAMRNNDVLPDNFGARIVRILENNKYYRNANGQIDGWGRKWLP
ncbi:MAG: DUF3800 domain-containing protein [Caldilineaceae bacterium]|nr:DUF3800 domain-containing protein [Caldilineaceae bacterium]MCB9161662.1 DUF3800 domain-containing protein [Caldilineaceae bacterium]